MIAALKDGADTVEDIIKKTGLPAVEVLSNLGILEIEGLVEVNNGRVRLLKK